MIMMDRGELFAQLDLAISARNPALAGQLRAGMPRASAERKLAKLPGDKGALLDLYKWHNGTEPTRAFSDGRYTMTFNDLSVVPKELFILPEFEAMMGDFELWKEAAKKRKPLRAAAGSCFPFLWDGGTTWLALDLKEENGGRVVVVEFESDLPVREAYPTFDECLFDLLNANRNDDRLTLE